MTEEEYKECERVLGPEPWDELDIPAYIRRREEEEAKAQTALEDEYIEEEKDRREKEELKELTYEPAYE